MRERNRARESPVPANVVAAQLREIEGVAERLGGEGFAAVRGPGPVTLVPRRARSPRSTRAARQREDPAVLDFGLQISRFGFPGHPATTARTLAEIARAAEETGFTSLWVMDHFLQIPQVGREWEDMLESYTTLGYLAGVTERIRLGTLVTGITYRNLAHLAKIVATLDVLSGGRAMCGLGTAWFEREHELYGWGLPPRADRYARLEDALELLPLMWGKGAPRFEGRTITVEEAVCYPRPLQERIPILVGGSGERKHAAARRAPRRRVQPLRRSRHRAPQGRRPARALRRASSATPPRSPSRTSRAARVVDRRGRRARAGRGDRRGARRPLPRARRGRRADGDRRPLRRRRARSPSGASPTSSRRFARRPEDATRQRSPRRTVASGASGVSTIPATPFGRIRGACPRDDDPLDQMRRCCSALAALGLPPAAAAATSAAPPKPGFGSGAIEAPSDCAVSTVVAVDATGASARQVARPRRELPPRSRAAEQTITAGGHLRMFVFAGDANAVEVIYDDDVPTIEQSDETRRGPDEQALRAALGTTLDGALGVTRDDPALARRVRELLEGGTSDIARAVRNALRSLGGESGAKALTLVSDGAQSGDQLDARAAHRGRRSGADDLATSSAICSAARATSTSLQAVGLGRLPERVNQSARRTDELVEIWIDGLRADRRERCATTRL